MPRYLIGVDTGGTYTDAVIVDGDTHAVIASAKSLTTYGDLAQGVSASLRHVLDKDPDVAPGDIQQVSLSTTLATNAIVEGRGSPIAVVLIGFDDAMRARTNIAEKIPEAKIISITGGHRHDGHEQAPLDERALREACEGLPVDAYAVASHYAVRNPSHERRASSLIQELTGKPVSASCDLSDSLNGPLRAVTAALNARIISLIVDLTRAVAQSMEQLGIHAPVMIVKGDGTIASARSVIEKPIETILSGPAASVIGARVLTGLNDFVVADMGGTTTDVATVTNGWPQLNARGANIGGFHTLVEAIDMQTIGLGGDSHVLIDESGTVKIDTARVVPISMLARLFPVIEKELEAALGQNSGMRSALDYLVLNTRQSTADYTQLNDKQRRFIATLNPDKPGRCIDRVNSASDRACVNTLLDRGVLRRSGFTPSDAAHVLGLQDQWSTSAACVAAELLTRTDYRVLGKDTEVYVKILCREIIEAVTEKSTRLMLNELSGVPFATSDALVTAVSTGQSRLKNIDIQLNSRLPLVAVGGPATVFYPEVGDRLNTDTRIPRHSDVANAIGAAVGIVRAKCSVEITLNESGGYLIHTDNEPEFEQHATQALTRSRELAQRNVLNMLQQKGGQSGHVMFEVKRVQTPHIEDDTGLISATVTASCDSLPTG